MKILFFFLVVTCSALTGCAMDTVRVERATNIDDKLIELLSKQDDTDRQKDSNKTLVQLKALGADISCLVQHPVQTRAKKQTVRGAKKLDRSSKRSKGGKGSFSPAGDAINGEQISADVGDLQSLLAEAAELGNSPGKQKNDRMPVLPVVFNFGDNASINTGAAGTSSSAPQVSGNSDNRQIFELIGRRVQSDWEVAVDKGADFAVKVLPWYFGSKVLEKAFDASGDRVTYNNSNLSDSANIPTASGSNSSVPGRVDDDHSDKSVQHAPSVSAIEPDGAVE